MAEYIYTCQFCGEKFPIEITQEALDAFEKHEPECLRTCTSCCDGHTCAECYDHWEDN